MARSRSWWRTKQLRHRDAVVTSVASAACLLAGELADQHIVGVIRQYLIPVESNPVALLWILVLVVLGYMSFFGGILVLLGGIHFSWGRVPRGRFFLDLGLGISVLALARALALATLTYGTPVGVLIALTTSLTGLGILAGLLSHVLMGEYALLLKKHARSAWRRWRRSRPPARRGARS